MDRLRNVRRNARMIRHVRPSQLGFRALRSVQARIEPRMARLLRRRLRYRVGDPTLRLPIPPAAVPLDSDLAEFHEGRLTVRSIGRSRTFTFPIDWQMRGADRPIQAWRMNFHQQLYLPHLDDDTACQLIVDWIANNPAYAPSSHEDGWHANVVSIRVVVWLEFLALRPHLAERVAPAMARSITEQILYLEEHLETDLGGNHFLRNVRALMWAGTYVNSPHSPRWVARATTLLEEQCAEQFLSDGVHHERSPAYHVLAVMDILTTWQPLPEGPTRSRLETRIDDMMHAMQALVHPDGDCSLFNDSWMKTSVSAAQLTAAWHEYTGRSTTLPPVSVFPEAGYVRFSGKSDHVLWDAGRIAPDHLPAHGHGDCLAFEYSIGEQRIIVDTGTFQYHAGAVRDYCRGTAAHNTVTLDDGDQCEFFGAFRTGRRLNVVAFDVAETANGFEGHAAHDGYAHLEGAPIHHRTLSVSDGDIRFDDNIVGGSGQRATARLLLHPAVSVQCSGTTAELTVGGHRLQLCSSHPIEVHPAPWFPMIGEESATQQIVVHYGDCPARGWMHLKRIT